MKILHSYILVREKWYTFGQSLFDVLHSRIRNLNIISPEVTNIITAILYILIKDLPHFL